MWMIALLTVVKVEVMMVVEVMVGVAMGVWVQWKGGWCRWQPPPVPR